MRSTYTENSWSKKKRDRRLKNWQHLILLVTIITIPCKARASSCNILGDSAEQSVAAAASLVCGVGGVQCDDSSGVCRVSSVAADLSILNNVVLTNITLTSLVNVSGQIHISGNSALQTLSFPQLRGAGSCLIESNNLLTVIEVPLLSSSGSRLWVRFNPTLQMLRFPLLTASEVVLVNNMDALVNVSFPVLAEARVSLQFINNGLLRDVSAPLMQSCGSVYFQGCGSLNAVNFPSLFSTTDSMWIESSAVSHVLFPRLSSVGSFLWIRFNDNLKTLGLSNLTWVGSYFLVNNNIRLVNISAPMLNETRSNFQLLNNPSLSSLHLPKLSLIGSNMSVDGCNALTEISLPELGYARRITIETNPVLNTIAFPKLRSVFESFWIRFNSMLAKLLTPSLSVSGNYLVNDNPALLVLNCSSLSMIRHDLILESNAALSSVSFPNLVSVAATMWIRFNPSLRRVISPNLTQLGSLRINDNPALTLLELPLLSAVDMQLLVETNSVLAQIDLPLLQSTGTSFWVRFNPLLNNLTCGMLASTGTFFFINNNDALASLDFGALYSTGHFQVINNAALINPSFPSLTSSSSFLFGDGQTLVVQGNATYNATDELSLGQSTVFYPLASVRASSVGVSGDLTVKATSPGDIPVFFSNSITGSFVNVIAEIASLPSCERATAAVVNTPGTLSVLVGVDPSQCANDDPGAADALTTPAIVGIALGGAVLFGIIFTMALLLNRKAQTARISSRFQAKREAKIGVQLERLSSANAGKK